MSSPTSVHLPASMEDVRITALPNSAFYISNFISADEEDFLLGKTLSQPASCYNWRQLNSRRLQIYPSELTDNGVLRKEALPSWLEYPIIPRLLSLKLSPKHPGDRLFSNAPHQRPNHVLLNHYDPGSGIRGHEDGPRYFPLIATVSLGAPIVLDMYDKTALRQNPSDEPQPDWRILQEPRSLLVTTGSMYTDMLHGIKEVMADEGCNAKGIANWDLLRDETREDCVAKGGVLQRQLRISATLRDVIKVKDYSKILPGLSSRRP